MRFYARFACGNPAEMAEMVEMAEMAEMASSALKWGLNKIQIAKDSQWARVCSSFTHNRLATFRDMFFKDEKTIKQKIKGCLNKYNKRLLTENYA